MHRSNIINRKLPIVISVFHNLYPYKKHISNAYWQEVKLTAHLQPKQASNPLMHNLSITRGPKNHTHPYVLLINEDLTVTMRIYNFPFIPLNFLSFFHPFISC